MESEFNAEIDVDGYTYKELMRFNYRGIIGINKRLDKINGRINQHDDEIFQLSQHQCTPETNAFHLNASAKSITAYKIFGGLMFILLAIGGVSSLVNIFK